MSGGQGLSTRPSGLSSVKRPSFQQVRREASFSEERGNRTRTSLARSRSGRSAVAAGHAQEDEAQALLSRLSSDSQPAHNSDEVARDDGISVSTNATSDTPRSAYEKKIDLVTQAIDDMGFGRYQWGLFFVCGSGWLLDLLWAHAFGLAMPVIQRELGFSERQYGFLSTGFSIGMTIGALTWGVLLDTLGRRAAFNYTVAISSIFGICIGFTHSYALLVFLAAGVGFGVGGNIPVDTTIFLEFIPQRDRTMLVVMSIFQPIGSILSTLVAWALIPRFSCASNLPACANVSKDEIEACCASDMNPGWRYMFYTISGITLLIFGCRFVVFTMLESPAFLLSHGRDEQAVMVIQQVAQRNDVTTDLTLDQIVSQVDDDAILDQAAKYAKRSAPSDGASILDRMFRKMAAFDMSHLKLLFKNSTVVRLSLLTWLIYAADFWGFTLAGVFLPKILLQKGATQHLRVTDTYRQYIFIALAGIPGALVSMLLIRQGLSRRLTMIASSIMMAASLLLFATVSTNAGNLIFNCVEYFAQTIFNAILYAWTPEVFEPSVRGSATGIAAFWGRLISIVAPLFGSLIYALPGGGTKVLFAAGGGTLVATLSIILLP